MYAMQAKNPNILFRADNWYEQVSQIVVEQIIEDELWEASNGFNRSNPVDQDTIDRLKNSFYYFCNLEPVDEYDQRYKDLVESFKELETAIEGVRAHPVLAFVLLMYNEGIINNYTDWEQAYRIDHNGQGPDGSPNTPDPKEVTDEFIDMAEFLQTSGIFQGAMVGSPVDVFVNKIANIPIDMRTVMKIAKKFTSSVKMKEILKLCGQINATANNRRMGLRKTDQAEGETKGFQTSNDLTRMTSGQMVKRITSPLQFRNDVAQGTLETKHQQGLAKTRGGPVIIVMDESGSMQGENEVWAKSLGIFLVQEAIRQNRTVAVVSFATKARGPNIYRTRNFDTDKFLDEEIIKFASGGGTNFHNALRAAADINDARKGWDVIFITDGMDGSSHAEFKKQLDRLKAHNTRIMGISIDNQVSARMKEMTDDCLVVNTRSRKQLMEKSDEVLQWLEQSAQMTI